MHFLFKWLSIASSLNITTQLVDKAKLSLLLGWVKKNTTSAELWQRLRQRRQDQNLLRIGSLDKGSSFNVGT